MMISLRDSRQMERSPESIETTARIFRSPADLGAEVPPVGFRPGSKNIFTTQKMSSKRKKEKEERGSGMGSLSVEEILAA